MLLSPLSFRIVKRTLIAIALSAATAVVMADPPTGMPAELNALPAVEANPPATSAAPETPGFAKRMRDKASDMVLTAMNFLGVPYRRGGSNETAGFDCSGFTRHIFEKSLGLVLPRRVDEQAHAAGLVAIRKDELQPGDLVFFNTLKRTFSHVGIYVGDGKFIHSPRPGGEVRMESMLFPYWTKRFTGARRVEASADAATAGADSPAAATN